MKRNYCVGSLATALILLLTPQLLFAAYKPVAPRELKPGEVAIDKPGSYAKANTTYVLTKDISSETTPIFLGKDVTLDLNGHTITFAKGKYEHIPNHGFEDGLKNWDTSKAPGAKVVSKTVLPFVGEKILELPVGEEIISQYITLPVANRSYYAVVACGKNQHISIYVDDENGNPVKTIFQTKQANVGCPVENVDTVFGGGTIFAHLHNLPAGKYRVRVKALKSKKDNVCWLDEVDILPAFDSGIAVVGVIKPYANYTAMRKWHPCAFFDFNKNCAEGSEGKQLPSVPLDSIPAATGQGKITIKNGIIRNGTELVRSWAVHSNANDVRIVLDNLRIINSGLNANCVRASNAESITNCRFEVDTPFIINRHNFSEASVNVSKKAGEIAHNEFLGGQGNLTVGGDGADIHDNLFVNEGIVTNHYSLYPGNGAKVYNNRFEPRAGAGIYLYRSHDVEIYDNVFRIKGTPPNCEYRYSKFSASAIRLSDYNAKPGPKACWNHRIYRNKIHVQAKAYPEYKGYKPHAYAFFISVGGGTNYIYDNEITVENNESDPSAGAYAFFIGSSNNGGEIYNNKVTTNCSIAWIGNDYGSGKNIKFCNNTFIRAENTLPKYKAFILGDGGNTAENISFFSNTFQGWKNQGWKDLFSYHTHLFSYSMGWTLTVKLLDKNGKQIKNQQILIRDKDGKEVVKLNTDEGDMIKAMLPEYVATAKGGHYRNDNWAKVTLPEYVVTAKGKKVCSTYTVSTGKIETNEIQQQIQLTKDMTVELREE